jgi:hypothetical protein
MTVTRAIHLMLLLLLAAPALAAAQTGVASVPVPPVSGGFGIALFNFGDATSPPVAAAMARSAPETSRFGGSLWFNLKVREHLRVVFELSGYNQPWTPRTTFSGRVSRENKVGFVVAGPRLLWAHSRGGEGSRSF